MNFMRYGLLAGMVLAAGCGGSSNNDDKSPRDPYVEFRVNDVLEPKTVTLDWEEVPADDDGGFCNPDVFENGQAVLDSSDVGYCGRSIANVSFSVRFTNPTYEDVEVSYKGIGFEVHVFEYDNGVMGPEVWNSSYYYQRPALEAQEDDASYPDFDPEEETTVTLKASDSIPSYANFITVIFEGDQIFNVSSYPTYDPNTAETALTEVKTPVNLDCDWALRLNDTATAYEKVRCLGTELLPEPGTGTDPIQFLARVTFNFNGWTDQPDDIIITLNPPD